MIAWNFDTSYASLPEVFFSKCHPTPVSSPTLVIANPRVAEKLGLEYQSVISPDGIAELAGNCGSKTKPVIAQAYAGHQFGHFTMLGDGRALLLGEHIAPSGARFDIQLKGPGPTPYSRRGDGRAALSPMLREYLISEAMVALGIPSTESLAVVATGEPVYRENPLPGAVLTRVASSHLRVGTFEYAASIGDLNALRALVEYAITRHFPECSESNESYLEFLRGVIKRQVHLIAQWMSVGFVHGVMNTDNMAISGETIDYGPCAFIDTFNPATVFSSIDRNGRYSYENQPVILQWNLSRFAETLLPLLSNSPDESLQKAQIEIDAIPVLYRSAWLSHWRRKLGFREDRENDDGIITELLRVMSEKSLDFTFTLRSLGTLLTKELASTEPLFHWAKIWIDRVKSEGRELQEVKEQLRSVNPAVIPRNFKVEQALQMAENHGDLSYFNELLTALKDPYSNTVENTSLFVPPPPSSERYRTFCGT